MKNHHTTDVIIIGQGIAGTTLGWSLYKRGTRFLLIDAGIYDGASHIAAGLVTPITGKRFTQSTHFDQLHEKAVDHYDYVSLKLGKNYLEHRPALRLCYSDEEKRQFEKRITALLDTAHVQRQPDQPNEALHPASVSFSMPMAAKLNTHAYLQDSREFFRQQGLFIEATVDAREIEIAPEEISLPALHVRAKQIVFCGGFADCKNPWLPESALQSAKGEVLTVCIENFNESRTIYANGIWLTATGKPNHYYLGATYDPQDLTTQITQQARDELTTKLKSILKLPFTMVNHVSAIRPVGAQRKVIVGHHHLHNHVSWLNGLGSKGVLVAPYLAHELTRSLHGEPLRLSWVDAID